MTRLALLLVGILVLTAGGTFAHPHGVPDDPMDVRPLTEGMPVPEGLEIRTGEGEPFDLSSALTAEPSILLFYRGGWCPFCNVHLGEIAEIETELRALGYRLVAVSPDRPEKVAASAEKFEGVLALLSDSDMEAAGAFGLSFRVPDDVLARYEQYGLDLAEASGRDHLQLPVPAAFVITEGIIRLAYVNPDYRTRVDAEVLLTAARQAQRAEDGRE